MVQALVYRDFKLAGENPPVEAFATLRQEPGVMLWVDLMEPTPDEIRVVLQEAFALHPLTIEDCIQDSPLPKLEPYEGYLYLVMHAVDYSRTEKFTTTELDLVLGTNFLITVHRRALKPVQAVRERYLKAGTLLVRGPDRLAHTLLDAMVENYRPALEELRREVEKIEEAVLAKSRARLTEAIVEAREDLTALRRIVRPQREIVAQLAAGQTGFFRPKLLPYLRDLTDDLLRIEEQVAGWSEQLIFAFRLHLNRASHEANAGIRVLTGLTAVTIPLMLVGTWFAMNFHNMPLLHSRAAYWISFAVTVVSTAVMFVYLRRRKWF